MWSATRVISLGKYKVSEYFSTVTEIAIMLGAKLSNVYLSQPHSQCACATSLWLNQKNMKYTLRLQSDLEEIMSNVLNIFVVHVLISDYINTGHKLFCAFVDCTKAFDSVARNLLWYTLQALKETCVTLFNQFMQM